MRIIEIKLSKMKSAAPPVCSMGHTVMWIAANSRVT